MQFNQRDPNWVKLNALVNQFNDESDLFQYGQEESIETIQINVDFPQKSAWSTHPSIDPKGRYKFSSMDLYLDPRVLNINRSTYDILDCLGDVGGLMDAIVTICKIIMLPVTTFNLKRFLLTIMFRLVPSK